MFLKIQINLIITYKFRKYNVEENEKKNAYISLLSVK